MEEEVEQLKYKYELRRLQKIGEHKVSRSLLQQSGTVEGECEHQEILMLVKLKFIRMSESKYMNSTIIFGMSR